MKKCLNVLLIEDDTVDAQIVMKLLDKLGGCDVKHAESHAAAKDMLVDSHFDVTLLDLALPESMGVDTVIAYRDYGSAVPAIVLTGMNNQVLADEAIRKGAQDYLVKGEFDASSLDRAIRYAIDRHKLLEQIVVLMQDSLTEERSRIVEETAGGVAHELNQPLTVILTSATMLLKGCSPGDARFEILEALCVACRKMEGVVENIRNAKNYATQNYLEGTNVLDLEASARFCDVSKNQKYNHDQREYL